MRPGDSVEIKTPNAVAGIRGTVIIAEVDRPETASSPVATRFTLLTGIVDVTLLDPTTGRPTGPAVTMNPLQTLAVTGFTPPAGPRPITRAEADRVAGTFAAPLRDPSGGANAQIVDNQVQDATKRSAAVAGDTGGDKGKLQGDSVPGGNSNSNGNGNTAASGSGNGGSSAGNGDSATGGNTAGSGSPGGNGNSAAAGTGAGSGSSAGNSNAGGNASSP